MHYGLLIISFIVGLPVAVGGLSPNTHLTDDQRVMVHVFLSVIVVMNLISFVADLGKKDKPIKYSKDALGMKYGSES